MIDEQFWRAEAEAHIHLVPHHLQEGVIAHIMRGRPTGSFLSAVFANDLREAVAHGDDDSLAGLKGLVQFLHNYAPGGCFGSPAKFKAWRANGGVEGIYKAEEKVRKCTAS